MPCNFWVMVHKLIQTGSYATRQGHGWRISYDDENEVMVYETRDKQRVYVPTRLDMRATDWTFE